jgi:acyl-CoA thioesterase I
MLKRLGFAIPSGTTIVILDTSGGYYNNTKTNTSRERGTSDMRQIETQLKSRGITVIPESTADIATTYRQSDHKHLTVEGHKLVATRLLPLVISALGDSHSSG